MYIKQTIEYFIIKKIRESVSKHHDGKIQTEKKTVACEVVHPEIDYYMD